VAGTNSQVVDVSKIDTVTALAVNVIPTNADAWTQSDVSFALSALNTPYSGAGVYEMRYVNGTWNAATGAWEYGAFGGWTEITLSGGTYTFEHTADLNRRVQFRVKSGSVLATSVESNTYRVMIATDNPTVLAENIFAEEHPGDPYTTGYVHIRVTIDWGFAGTGTWQVKQPGEASFIMGSWDDVQIVNGQSVYLYRAAVNGTYTFAATSSAGLSALSNATAVVSEIESANLQDITFDVTVTPHGTNIWTQNEVTFDLEVTSDAPSHVYWQYKRIPNGEVADSYAWIDLTIEGGSGGIPGYLNKVTLTLDDNFFYGTVLFRAYAGIDTGFERVKSFGPYNVLIDKVPPVLTVLDTPPTVWTNQNVTIRVKVAYSALMGTLTVNPTFSYTMLPGDPAADEANGIYVYAFTFTANGTITVQAKGLSQLMSDPATIIVDRIDKTVPTFTVVASNADAWTNQSVVFAFSPGVNGGSGLTYQYSTDSGSTWSNVAGNSLTLSNAADNGSYIFRALSDSLVPSAQSGAYGVMIDRGVPQIELIGALPSALTNRDVTVKLKVTFSISDGIARLVAGSGTLFEIADESDPANGVRIYSYTFTANGTISVQGYGYNGVTSDPFEVTLGVISKVAPIIKGTVGGVDYLEQSNARTELNGKEVKANVEIFIENYGASTVKVVKGDKDITGEVKFTNGTSMFTENGTYTITVTDAWGNTTAATFSIAKPNYTWIILGSILGLIAIAVVAVLLYFNIRNKKMLKRLIGEATVSDDSNKFLMFKKIK
jgi:hypothetical protein